MCLLFTQITTDFRKLSKILTVASNYFIVYTYFLLIFSNKSVRIGNMDTTRLFQKLIFTNDELFSCFETRSKAYYWAASARKKNHIAMIKPGLYAAVNPATGLPYVSKFMIASRITASSCIAYHSALEYHGLANQVYNNVYAASKENFTNFDFLDVEYERVKLSFSEGIDEVVSSVNIRVTDIERTIVDCVDDIRLAGGIEELLNALDFIKRLDETKLLRYLLLYNKKSMYQKTGYILKQYQTELNLSDDFFNECRKYVGKKCFYFLEDTLTFGKTVFSSEWNMMAPSSLRGDYLGEGNG